MAPMMLATMAAVMPVKQMIIVCCIESNRPRTSANPAFISPSTLSKRLSTLSKRTFISASSRSNRLSRSSKRWLTFSLRSSSRSSVHASLAITAMKPTIGGVLSTVARQMQIFWDDFRERVELAAGRLYEVLGSDQEKAQYRADEADDRAD